MEMWCPDSWKQRKQNSPKVGWSKKRPKTRQFQTPRTTSSFLSSPEVQPNTCRDSSSSYLIWDILWAELSWFLKASFHSGQHTSTLHLTPHTVPPRTDHLVCTEVRNLLQKTAKKPRDTYADRKSLSHLLKHGTQFRINNSPESDLYVLNGNINKGDNTCSCTCRSVLEQFKVISKYPG